MAITLFTKTLSITSTFPIALLGTYTPPLCRRLLIRCSISENGDINKKNEVKNALSGLVGKQVEELLNREENRELLDGLEKASQRVENARRELAEIQRQQLQASQLRTYINQLESRASEIEECQKDIFEARAMVEEAERSLSGNADKSIDDSAGEEVSKDEERLESIKAALISASVGILASLPISLTRVTSIDQLLLPSSITFISCALFGVTFRYAVRRDLDNFQLKTGTSAAFGFVKGLATLGGGSPLEINPGSILSHTFDGAVYVSENLLIFLFAAISLDFCFKTRFLSPFPMKRLASRDP